MKPKKLTLSILAGKFGICHLGKNNPIPSWAVKDSGFSSIAKTDTELSIVCPQENIPVNVIVEKNWRVLKVKGPLGFSLTGIVASLAAPLAEAKISILYISTCETDYLMVEEKTLAKTVEILGKFCAIKNQ